MDINLSKTEKKLCRDLIETGLQKEFAQGLEEMDAILTQWKNKKSSNRDTYHLLYKKLTNFDKHIARRYDGITGSRYLSKVAEILADGLISKQDLEGFGPEAREVLERWSSVLG